MSTRLACLLGLGILLAQLLCTLLFSFTTSPTRAYFKLIDWDSYHYRNIAEKGYSYPAGGQVTSADIHEGRANVVFFPGYPAAAALVHRISGVSMELALLLVAHFSAWIAWTYLLLLFKRMGLEPRQSLWAAFLVAAYPSAFFVVAAYTESLFLAASLGFIYWCDRWTERKSASAWGMALLHGWVLSFTRIVGFAVAAYPVCRDFVRKRITIASVALLVLSVLASVSFFVYCQLKFGDWAVYFKLEEIGWQNHRMYLAIINPLSYIPHFFFENTVDSFSRSSVTFCGFLFVAWGMTEWKIHRETGALPEQRLARALVAFAMFYIALTGKANANMDSMLRYTLPVYILMILNFAELRKLGPSRKMTWALVVAIGIQCWNMYRFTHGRWVA